ncbi:MAG: DMT family transporter [Acidimicrobiales bacterium]
MTTTAPSVPVAAPAQRPALGVAAATSAVVVWGISSVAIKQVEGLNGLGVATYRIWLGAALVTTAFLVSGGRLSRRMLRLSLWGGLAFCADLVLFFCALRETSVANATVIGALQPLLLLAVAGPLFGERARAVELWWGAAAIVGAGVVVLGGDGGGANSWLGNLLAVGALLSWTAYFVFTKTARRSLTAFEYLTGMAIVAAVAIIPVALVFDGALGTTDTSGWITIVYITLVNGLLGHFLMSWSHNHVSLLTLSLLTLAIPVIGAGAAAVWIDEPLQVVQVGGMVVVLAALALVSVSSARRQPEATEVEGEALETAPRP